MSLYVTAQKTYIHTVKDVPADKFIDVYSKHLKQSDRFPYPKWADFVKTGHAKELAPYDADWIYVRAASMLRQLYLRPNTGVGGFRKLYGSKKRRGSAPAHSTKASGKIIRYILQKFESMGLVETVNNKGGRKLTKEGQRELDIIARQMSLK